MKSKGFTVQAVSMTSMCKHKCGCKLKFSMNIADNQPIHKFLSKRLSQSCHSELCSNFKYVQLLNSITRIITGLDLQFIATQFLIAQLYLLLIGVVEWAFRRLYTKYLRNLKIFINLIIL